MADNLRIIRYTGGVFLQEKSADYRREMGKFVE
jgi:hypothetical protein